jgi:sucrose-6F-phosphate phosphohydrolase
MMPRLLCTDLDRTLLPNGNAPESPSARDLFARVVARAGLSLAYVTGRRLSLVTDAITLYSLPHPRFAICDVGTSIYEHDGTDWVAMESWQELLAKVWPVEATASARALMEGIDRLELQEEDHQSRFKISYYAPVLDESADLLAEVESRLAGTKLDARLVYSVDETTETGLLDLLPPTAGKLAAIEHLLERSDVEAGSTLFAGDSGNDLEVLASEVPSVLVANATERVRREAVRLAAEGGHRERLYLATGQPGGMNGNYAAGILEGIAHFWPPTASWMK